MSARDNINNKLDRIGADVAEIRVIQARMEGELKHHIRRTDLAEENLSLLRAEVEPVKAHVDFINNLAKFFVGLIAAGGSIAAIIHYLG